MENISITPEKIAIKNQRRMTTISKSDILSDYKVCCLSRTASLTGRREVLSGKAKFGIFGDGKELAQVALSHFCKPGDWRSGYYRDQTLMMALGVCNPKMFFAQLYADTDVSKDPFSGGRQMNAHFATRYIDEDGSWKSQMEGFNVAADLSPTAGQMARLVGLGYASKYYKQISGDKKFSNSGQEVAYGMIGNASTSEGHFWETINAIGVLQVPVVVCVWDDGYGISVPNKYQTTKDSISTVLKGFQADDDGEGLEIIKVRGWNYTELLQGFAKAEAAAREQHRPVLIHVIEMTQPQGHSTSGSHERYKSEKRLEWEQTTDCIQKFKAWIIENGYADEKELKAIEQATEKDIEEAKIAAWKEFQKPLESQREEVAKTVSDVMVELDEDSKVTIQKHLHALTTSPVASQKACHSLVRKTLLRAESSDAVTKLENLSDQLSIQGAKKYNHNLFFEHEDSSGQIVNPEFSESSKKVDGREVIQKYFDTALERDERIFIIGEDIGKLGGVNLEFEGLQKKHGEHRVTDTGIREATILGQGLGAAFRGLRPIVDIQYLDYLLYCIQGISDDLATLHYRTKGGQLAPVIVRTKGHRLEGIWHTGSPISMILGSVRGCYLCVPRNSVQAAGMYQTLLNQQNPGIVIEVLNGYRVKEKLPENIGEYRVPLGEVDTIVEGSDITIVTYGACVRVAEQAVAELSELGVSAELMDVQTLLPFDNSRAIVASIMKTGAVLFLDEDVPGGGTSYMMQKTLDHGGGFDWLDSKPTCLSAAENRGAYGSDADYYCKPSVDDVVEKCLSVLEDAGRFQF